VGGFQGRKNHVKQPTGGKKIRQKSSHAALLQSLEVESPLFPPSAPQVATLDAIIIPASRRASSFDNLIKLSARLGARLVVICSKLAKIEDVAERVARTPGARALIIEIPKNYRAPQMPGRTSSRNFREASAGRTSDLSAKRNLGLLLARLNGWNKIVFVDDDITLTDTAAFARLARRLERVDIAGMVCKDFPDNSVVCHARRLAGLPQDNFVSGSVLGVNCADLPVPFFPDIYNEDWFFFSKAVARFELESVGTATQRPYKPYADPERARHEEFGDLLAEGLFSLIGEILDQPVADEGDDKSIDYYELFQLATVEFWKEFIEARRDAFQEIRELLEPRSDGEAQQALRSLAAADRQLDRITPELCTAFLGAWQEDLGDWEIAVESTNSVTSTWEVMNELGLRKWRLAESGDTQLAKPQRGAARRGHAAERRAPALNYAR
jgi:hypothetical protein